MKKLVQILTVSVFMLASTTAFSKLSIAERLELKRWDSKMEKLARAGDESAIAKEHHVLENQLKNAETGSKEAELLKEKLAKMPAYYLD